MMGGYGPSRRDAEGTRLAPLMNGVCAVVVAGSEPATAVAVAIGAARVQCATRRVAVADLVGDAPLILRLLPDDDPHGISDSFLYGVSFNKIARPVEGEDQLFLIPSGSEPVTTEAIYANDRWRRLSAGFHQVGALLVVVARPEVPGFAALCTHVGAVLPVGEVPLTLPAGVVVLRPEPEPEPVPAAPTAPTALEALLAQSAATDRESRGMRPPPSPDRDGKTDVAGDGDSAGRGPRLGLKVDAQGIVRPKASRAAIDDEADADAPRPWWRAPRTLVLAAVVLAGITVGALNPGWMGQAIAPLTGAWRSLTGGTDSVALDAAAADSARAVAAATGQPTPAPADSAAPLAVLPDSTAVDTLPQGGAAGGPPSAAADSAAAVPVPPVVTPPKQITPPTLRTVAPPSAGAANPPSAAPAPSRPAVTAPPSAAPPRAALTVANPDDANRAARYAIYVATSNTRDGALPDPRLRGAEATALSPVTDGGARWYRLTVGAEPSRAEATALLARLRAKDPTVSGSIVALPYAFLVEQGVAAAQVPARLSALAGRGVFAYALRQGDGSGAIYTGAFESPEQARTLADSLRAVGMAPTLVYRTGRAF